ncbi:MAG: hypothetical protein AB1510_06215 [Bacillota bacterium]
MKALIVQHVICEGPGLLGDALLKRGWELDIRHMDRLTIDTALSCR